MVPTFQQSSQTLKIKELKKKKKIKELAQGVER